MGADWRARPVPALAADAGELAEAQAPAAGARAESAALAAELSRARLENAALAAELAEARAELRARAADAAREAGELRARADALARENAELRARIEARSAALAATEARLRLAFDAAGMGSWDWDLATGRAEWDDALRRLFGLPPDTPQGDISRFSALIHPEDRTARDAAIRIAVMETGEYRAEFRIRRADTGEERWLAARGRAVTGPDGRVERLVGVDFDITDRRAAEAALAENEARLRLAQEAAGAGAWEVDLRTGRMRLSGESRRLHGLPADHPEAFDEAEWAERIHPEDRAPARAAVARALAARGLYDFTYRVPLPDGSVRWIQGLGRAVYDGDGRATRMLGLSIDVTSSKRAEAALAASEAEFRAAFEGSGLPMVQSDYATGRYVRVNAAFCRLAGRPAADLVGRHYSEFTHPDDLAAQRAAIRRVTRGEAASYETVKRMLLPDGGMRWVRVSSSPVRDPAGRPIRTVAVFQDITEAKAAAEALRVSEERLRLAQSAGGIGAWEVDYATGRRHWSESTYRLWGIEPDTPVTLDLMLSVIHPEDRDRFSAKVAEAATRQGPLPEAEFRIVRPSDGAVRWLYSTGEAMTDEAGRTVRHLGIMRDITAQKEAEAALAESEERFRTLFEAVPVGVAVIDPETLGFVAVNDRACALLGYTREELARLRLPDVEAAMSEAEIRTEALARAARTRPREFETRHRTKSGAIRDVLVRTADVQLGGRTLRYSAWVDITGRKLAEARQALLAKELDHRAKNALAVVQAALRLTPKDDPEAYARAVEGRVAALARAHTMLAAGRWEGAELRALIEAELAAFLPSAEAGPDRGDRPMPRVEVEGAEVTLAPSAAQALSMALHELATNAVKYGALSVPAGRVAVRWHLDHAAGMLRLRWAESGGPPVAAPPRRRGFGSRVIEGTVRDQLGGRIERLWDAGGLACEMSVPIGRALARTERDRHPGDAP